jgi:type VI secretion system protein ImpM
MPDARAVAGLFGKVPAHGDFVRRGLPSSFVTPWDAWLQAAMAAARAQLGAQWEAAWDSAPAWRFALPPGACGPDAVAGVMLPSHDQVGRRFPLTLAALLPAGAAVPGADWFDAVEAAAHAGRAGQADADALAAAVPQPGAPVLAPAFALPTPGASHALAVPPAVAAPPPDAVPPGDGLAAQVPPVAATLPPDDVLALIGTAPRPPGTEEDALALLLGGTSGSAPLPAMPQAGATSPAARFGADGMDGTLAALIGAASADRPAPAPPGPAPRPDDAGTSAAMLAAPVGTPDGAGAGAAPDGTLGALIGAAPPLPSVAATESASIPVHPASGAADGTLAALIGAGASPLPDPAAPPTDQDTGILAGLIDAGADAMPDAAPPSDAAAPSALQAPGDATAPELPPAALPGAEAAAPDGADSADLLAEIPPGWHEPGPAAPAPAAPEGGGWWTRGGARVPPLVWPLAALPAPSDFAYLLESAA